MVGDFLADCGDTDMSVNPRSVSVDAKSCYRRGEMHGAWLSAISCCP